MRINIQYIQLKRFKNDLHVDKFIFSNKTARVTIFGKYHAIQYIKRTLNCSQSSAIDIILDAMISNYKIIDLKERIN